MGQGAEQKVEPELRQFAELGEEFAKYVGTLNLERETKAKVSQYIREIQAELSKQIALDPKKLSKWFPKAESAVVEDGAKLTVKQGKKATVLSLMDMDPDPYYAVVKEVGTLVGRMLAEEEKDRGAMVKPALQVFTRQTGRKAGVFDWRNYELILANTGGRAVGMTVTILAEGKWSFGPLDVDSMETTEIDLHDFSKIEKARALKIEVKCEDADGRGYSGTAELQRSSKSVRVFELAPAGGPAGA